VLQKADISLYAATRVIEGSPVLSTFLLLRKVKVASICFQNRLFNLISLFFSHFKCLKVFTCSKSNKQ
jgi:hypothetical protein